MTLSKQDAAAALSDIEQATGRGQTLRAYRSAGPVLILWGVIWIAGYVAMGLLPDQRWGWIWLWLDLIGVVASVVVSRRSGLGTMASRAAGWRGLAVAVFIGVALAIFHPKSTAPYLVFPALVLGLLYVVTGAPRMMRFVALGLAIFAATLVGWVFFQAWLCFWMAAVGGGGLLAGGLWMRRA